MHRRLVVEGLLGIVPDFMAPLLRAHVDASCWDRDLSVPFQPGISCLPQQVCGFDSFPKLDLFRLDPLEDSPHSPYVRS